MLAGALEIQLSADVARLRRDMTEVKGTVTSTMQDISRAAEFARTALGAIGAGLSVGALAQMVRHATEAADALYKMSQKTGIAVEQLSALKYAATLSDVSLESLGKGMKGLSQKMVEATDATGKAGQLMKTLGVDVQGGAMPAVEKLADAFAKLPDGPTKAALAVEIFGKEGMSLIPLLNQGADGIRKMRDEALRLGLVMDEETAKAAETFNDNMKVITMGSERLGASLVNNFAPGMVRVSAAMKEAAAESGTLMAIWVGLGGVASEALGLNASETEKTKARIREIQVELHKLRQVEATDLGGGVQDKARLVAAQARILVLQEELRLVEQLKKAEAGGFGDQVSRAMAQGKGVAGGTNSDLEARVRALLGLGTAGEKAAKAMKDLGLADAHVNAELKHRVELAKIANEEAQKAIDLDQRQVDAREAAAGSFRLHVEQLEFETTLLGKSNAEREIAIRLRALEKAGIDTSTASVAEYVDRIRAAHAAQEAFQAQQEALRDQASVWAEMSHSAGRFFADLAMNGREAFGNLREYLKRFLAEMVALFAQRWVLQLGAGLTGSAAIGAMAGSVGQGTLAGSLLSAGGGLLQSGLGSLLGGGTGGAVAASELLSMASAAGPYIAAIAGIATLFSAFRDSGENWKGKLGFGSNANAYTTTGPFGVQGFEYLAGNDATNRAIQTFMGSTLGLDRQLAGRMTPAQIAAITGRLTGAYSTRNDGQPAEFAFGKGDETAAQQLTLEFLQKKYSTIFDEIDTEFAAFIRGYTGKSEDLLKAIGEFAGLLDMLDATGIKGLNITTLRAFQKEGEELGATFARVTQQFATFQDLYYTDAEKVAMVQDQVAKVFADLGIALPASNEEFRKLVEGLDLSTEAGRKMFTALMGVAPAFNTVTNAAAAAVVRFNTLAATLSPSFGAANARSVLEARVRTWMGLTPANGEAGGWNVENTIANIGTLVRQGRIGEALTYAQSLGGNAVTVLNDMLEAYIAWTNAMQNAQSPVAAVGDSLRGLADAAAQAAARMADAKGGLWAYLQGLLVNPSLSPLPFDQQIAIARGQYDEQLRLAQGGDVGAASGLQGYISTLLNLARSGYASGFRYQEIFDYVMRTAGDFAREGGGEQLQIQQLQTQRSILDVLIDIRDRGTAGDAAIADAVSQSSDSELYYPRR